MHRTINSMLMLATLAAAFALYAVKYDTRKLEARVQAQERELDKAKSDVVVLTAERAHLARPERLEPLARLQGLEPIAPGQYVRLEIATETEADPVAKAAQPDRPAAIPSPSR
jgi:cell division protein FtsL